MWIFVPKQRKEEKENVDLHFDPFVWDSYLVCLVPVGLGSFRKGLVLKVFLGFGVFGSSWFCCSLCLWRWLSVIMFFGFLGHHLCSSCYFEKTYNLISWSFLSYMIVIFAFGERWCNWIRGCIFCCNLFMFVNWNPIEEINNQRGLKKRDLLAAFLFLLAQWWRVWLGSCKVRKNITWSPFLRWVMRRWLLLISTIT